MNTRMIIVVLLLFACGRAAAQEKRWAPIESPFYAVVTAMTIATDGTVYAGTDDGMLLTIRDKAIVRTDSVPNGGTVTDILMTSADDMLVAADSPFRFMPSERMWERLPITGATMFARSDGGVIVAAGGYQPYYRSIDDGASWIDIKPDGLPPSDQDLRGIAGGGGTFYATYQFHGVWRSTDSGATWQETGFHRTSDSLINASAVSLLDNGTVVLFGTNGRQPGTPAERAGIYRSTDRGETWTVSRPSPVHNRAIETVVTLKGHGTHLIAGIGYGRNAVVESTDGGDTWHDLVEGIAPDTTVKSVAVGDRDAYLSVLGDSQLYRLGSSVGAVPTDAESVSGMQVVPNPVAHEAALRMNVMSPGLVRVEIVDVFGRTVTVSEGTYDAGPQTVPLDISAFPSGAYMVVVREQSGTTRSAHIVVTR